MLSRSLPTDSCQNSEPVLSVIRTSQGAATSSSYQQAGEGPELAQPRAVAVEDGKGRDGEQAEEGDDRPLDQDRQALRDPEQPVGAALRLASLVAEIDRGKRALGKQCRGQQRRIGLGDARLEAEHHDAHQAEAGDHAGGAAEHAVADEGERQHGECAGKHRNEAIDPDWRFAALATDEHGRRLQPVDAGGLLVARHVLEADVDIVAALDHLLGGLDEARLVTIGRRQRGDAGRKGKQAQQGEQQISERRQRLARRL